MRRNRNYQTIRNDRIIEESGTETEMSEREDENKEMMQKKEENIYDKETIEKYGLKEKIKKKDPHNFKKLEEFNQIKGGIEETERVKKRRKEKILSRIEKIKDNSKNFRLTDKKQLLIENRNIDYIKTIFTEEQIKEHLKNYILLPPILYENLIKGEHLRIFKKDGSYCSSAFFQIILPKDNKRIMYLASTKDGKQTPTNKSVVHWTIALDNIEHIFIKKRPIPELMLIKEKIDNLETIMIEDKNDMNAIKIMLLNIKKDMMDIKKHLNI